MISVSQFLDLVPVTSERQPKVTRLNPKPAFLASGILLDAAYLPVIIIFHPEQRVGGEVP